MFRRTWLRRVDIYDTPFFEHMTWGQGFKRMSGGKAGLNMQQIPRNIHGYLEAEQPKTNDTLRWYPYKQELTVDGKLKPTFTDILNTYYWPHSLDDAQRISYIAEKTGRSEEELSSELFKMRRRRMAVGQCIRMKMRGRTIRLPQGDWDTLDRKYLMAAGAASYNLGMSWYSCPSFEPTVVYSPYYQFGDCVDMIINKPLRTSLQYFILDVCVHKSIPHARLPGVTGSCAEPIQDIEPCLYEQYKLKMGVMAHLIKKEGYVVDCLLDGGHYYLGGIIHIYDNNDSDGILAYEIVPIELDLDVAEKWLVHYRETVLAPHG